MRAISTVLFVLLIVVFSHRMAYAYIDPASGSYLLQLAIAGLLGTLFALKTYWNRVVLFVRSLFKKTKAAVSDE